MKNVTVTYTHKIATKTPQGTIVHFATSLEEANLSLKDNPNSKITACDPFTVTRKER